MLFLLIGLLLIASVLVLCLRKTKESIYLFGMCLSLMVQFSGILIFIAKKGGYSRDIIQFLFFSLELKTSVQYLYITLDAIGYMIAFGRYLFPLFLMEFALHYSMIPFLRRHPRCKLWVAALPLATLVVYHPLVFRAILAAFPGIQNAIVEISFFWIIGYVVAALVLLVVELFSVTIRFYKRKFSSIVVCMAALSGLFLLYCGQDPAQVYRFYSYDYLWNKGIGYLQYAPSVTGYALIVVVNVICGALGFTSLLRYTRDNFASDREELVLERKFDTARSGASVFVHSIKNQLLANRVLEKHIYAELSKPEPDIARVRESVDRLRENNELLISRSEELYRTVKNKSMRLLPVALSDVTDAALECFYKKHPEGRTEASVDKNAMVLADISYLSEALCNLLANAWEANIEAEHTDKPVTLTSRADRLYTVVEVRDQGMGIPRSEQKKVFEPFYSKKNSGTNWGMGLYHVRAIVKAHLGGLRIESEPGKGSSFFVLLPRYDRAVKS